MFILVVLVVLAAFVYFVAQGKITKESLAKVEAKVEAGIKSVETKAEDKPQA